MVAHPERKWTFPELAQGLRISASECHAAVRRLADAGLVDPLDRRACSRSVEEFLLHGMRYVFPCRPGPVMQGVPTAHSAARSRNGLAPPPKSPMSGRTPTARCVVRPSNRCTARRPTQRSATPTSMPCSPSSTRSESGARGNEPWPPRSFRQGSEVPRRATEASGIGRVLRALGSDAERVVIVPPYAWKEQRFLRMAAYRRDRPRLPCARQPCTWTPDRTP
ncbi:MAG TPA: helix-turn-helix domain-containing protein [Planctomycetota bacterium]|nr:helix-turn-helix domain-containing protein [Planctomycetota bacterium]